MREKSSIPPPVDIQSYGPSQLFRYFFQIGRWTEESFSDQFQVYTRGIAISTVTINKWKNHDVIPTRYAGPLFNLIKDMFITAQSEEWLRAFEIVWASHSARPNRGESTSDFLNSSDTICYQHRLWIQSLYDAPLFKEMLSPRELYIPMQLVEAQMGDLTLYESSDLRDLMEVQAPPQEPSDWTLITGDSGSGKSMLALHLAQELTQSEVMPIYLRGRYISDVDIDIKDPSQPILDSFSPQSFLKHFRASSKTTACLIIDGIEDICRLEGNAKKSLRLFLSNLEKEQNICGAHGKQLNIILSGRRYYIDYLEGLKTGRKPRRLETLNMDGSYLQNVKSGMILVGRDMRPAWWSHYSASISKNQETVVPNFLSSNYDDFAAFGLNPLMSKVLCDTALKNHDDPETMTDDIINRFSMSHNKNEIYRKVLIDIYDQLPPSPFERTNKTSIQSLLQYLALAHWHAPSGQNPQIKTLHKTIPNKNIRRTFQNFEPEFLLSDIPRPLLFQRGLRHNNPVSIALSDEELTEYLISTLLVDCFVDLVQSFQTKDGFKTAAKTWAFISSSGQHSPSLVNFCQNEVRLRFATWPDLEWDSALELLRDHLPTETISGNGLKSLAGAQSSASILFFLWSCFNLERHKRSASKFEFATNSAALTLRDVKRFYQKNILTFDEDNIIGSRPSDYSFITPSMSALRLENQNLSQLSFSTGHLQSSEFERVNFALTHWSHVKISRSLFNKSTFQQSIFHGCRWIKSTLFDCFFQGANIQNASWSESRLKNIIISQCHLADVHFLSTNFDNVIFDRCTFSNCSFGQKPKSEKIDGLSFRRCSFLDMRTGLKSISQMAFEDCKFPTTADFQLTSRDNKSFESKIRKILD